MLELNGKLIPTGVDTATARPGTGSVWEPQVIEALTGLGWTEKDAQSTLKALGKANPEVVETGNVSEILRAALRSMSTGTRAR